MRTTWDSSRRVGVWAARKRAVPARMRAASSDPVGPGVELADGGLVGLEPVELGVLGEQRVAERGDRLAGVAAGAQVAVDDRPGLVDVALLVPAVAAARRGRRAVGRRPSGSRAAGTLRNRSR